MKILVIDDAQKHLDAALQTLVGHDVTICSSHDEALKLLQPQYNESMKKLLLEKYRTEGGIENPYEKANKESALPYWDAVLCDLLMPAGRSTQGGEGLKFIGQEMPVGWSLALMAAAKGAKFVAVVTDMNHHSHPASAMLDAINCHIFCIDSAKMLMTNHVEMVGIAGTECKCGECSGTGKRKRNDDSEYGCYNCNGTGKSFSKEGKDWSRILNQLLGVKEKDSSNQEADA